jgi:hypothetical protein
MKQLTLNLQGDSEVTGETMKSSSLVASRNYANHSAPLEKEKGKMTNATCGAKCYEQYKKLNRNMSLQKMYMVSQILTGDWYSSRCALTWKLKGTKFSRLLFQLQVKTHHTGEIDAGLLLPTPNAAEGYKSAKTYNPNSQMGRSLSALAGSGMLPTPQARDYQGAETPEKYLIRKKLWETKSINLQITLPQILNNATGQNSQLNPQYVAEVMGFPTNWTELPFQNGEMNPSKHMEMQ